jgi:hypothetical protein
MSTPATDLEQADTQPDAPPAGSAPMRRRPLLWAGVAVLVLSLLANGWLVWRLRDATSANRERTQVASIARNFLVALTNFQAATIDRDVARIRSYATGDFAQQVRTFFDAQAIQTLKDAQAKSTGRVQSVFVETLNGGTATVFGLVNETVTNRSQPTARAEVLRVEIQLIDASEGWKVARVDILQLPTGSPLGG